MKTDNQITTIATNTLLNYFSDCEADAPVQKLHCLSYLAEASKPFNTLCSEHAQGRNSTNSIIARNALTQINKILFPLVVDDLPKKH
jgi:hypothetical protein